MLGDIIKQLRKNAKITQKIFADQMKVSKSTIAMWETNNREPDIETLKKIAEFFGVSVDYLTGSNITIDYSYIDETKEYCKKHFPKHSKDVECILNDLDCLNDKGISEVCKRVHELTMISEYSNLCLPDPDEMNEHGISTSKKFVNEL